MPEPEETIAPAPGEGRVGTEHLAALRASIDPQQVGPYRIIERLGEGGMGAVYKAEQRHPIRRTVAVKLIKAGCDTREVIARFDSERQALARMDHPHIAKVLDAGAGDTGQPYFVMEYVPGIAITKFADDNKLSVRQRLELFQQVCDAIAHAHTKAIIHRDIKASNVLALSQDGKPTVKVIDFGIAKAVTSDRLTDQTFATERGMPIGTYDSMSPEQADGSPDVDTRTDVYSLGVLLYELLAGAKPFDRDTLAKAADQEIRRIIREVDPPRPSARLTGTPPEQATKVAAARQSKADELARQLRKELEWIPLKAMRKERDRRYASPQQLAEDIDNYLAGRPLLAGPESAAYRTRKFVRRHRAPLLAAGAVAAALVIGLGAAVYGLLEASRQRDAARQSSENERQQREVADQQRELADSQAAQLAREREQLAAELSRSNLLRGKLLLESGEIDEAEKLLWRVYLATDSPQDRRAYWGLWKLYYEQPQTLLPWKMTPFFDYSRNGQFLALSADSGIQLIDLDTNKLAATFSSREWQLGDVAVSPKGTFVASVCENDSILIWNAASPHQPPKTFNAAIDKGGDVTTQPAAPADLRIFCVDDSRILAIRRRTRSKYDWLIVKAATAELIWQTEHWSPADRVITANEQACVVATEGLILRCPLSPPSAGASAVVTILAKGSDRLSWMREQFSPTRFAASLLGSRRSQPRIHAAAASDDGAQLLVAESESGKLSLWDLRSMRRLSERSDISLSRNDSLAISHDGQRALHTSPKNTTIFSLPTLSEIRTFAGPLAPVSFLHTSRDDKSIAASDRDGSIRRYELEAAKMVSQLGPGRLGDSIAAEGPLVSVKLPLDLRGAQLWEAGQPTRRLPREVGEVMNRDYVSTPLCDDGKTAGSVFASSDEVWIRVYDLASGKSTARVSLGKQGRRMSNLAWSRDGQRMAIRIGGEIVLFSPPFDEPDRRIQIGNERSFSTQLSLSPDGTRVAAILDDWELIVTPTQLPQQLSRVPLPATRENRRTISFAPDGSYVAVASSDRIDFFESTDLRSIRVIEPRLGEITSFAIAADGSTLAIGFADGTVRLWDAARNEELLSLSLGDGELKRIVFSLDGNRIRYIAARRAAELNLRAFDRFIDANRPHFAATWRN